MERKASLPVRTKAKQSAKTVRKRNLDCVLKFLQKAMSEQFTRPLTTNSRRRAQCRRGSVRGWRSSKVKRWKKEGSTCWTDWTLSASPPTASFHTHSDELNISFVFSQVVTRYFTFSNFAASW